MKRLLPYLLGCVLVLPPVVGHSQSPAIGPEKSGNPPALTGPAKPTPAAVETKAAPAKIGEETPPPPPLVARMVRSDAISGQPFGVAQLTIPLGDGPSWQPDQPVIAKAADDRVLFPCHAIRKTDDGDELVVRFLFHGSKPLSVDVDTVTGTFVKGRAIPVDDDRAGHQTLLKEWWANYTEQLVEGPSEELSSVGLGVAEILARQLGLPMPAGPGGDGPASSLERQFERSAGLLFGFESVRLAMMKDATPTGTEDSPATLALPRPIAVRPVPVPDVTTRVEIEPLAAHTPPEYFYLRCRSFQNYLWLRGFLMGWGGNLNEMVATPVVDHRIRERIERQLCLDPALALKLDLDGSLEDFALLGGDTYFAEGAAVGVLMLARNGTRVQTILDSMRQALAESRGATLQTLTISGRSVSCYQSPDNSVRSYYVTQGDCHLVTNSRILAERFFACQTGRNLATLPEFRHARSKFPASRDVTAFLYLSDPFFRNLTNPATRIEAARRQRAAEDLRQLNLARLICTAEGLKASTIADLVAHRLVLAEIKTRADGSSPLWMKNGQFVDSLRGGLGTFVPISDIAVLTATQGEVAAYSEFTRSYLREWQAMDPVLVALNRSPTQDPREERVDLEIMITPYARNAYEFLARHLAPASQERVRPSKDDVLALTARLRSGATYDICVGLRDVEVPFRVEKGSLVKDGAFERRTFADWQSYAAVSPAGQDGLELLGRFTQSLQSRRIDADSAGPESRMPAAMQLAGFIDGFAFPLGGFATSALASMIKGVASSYTEEMGAWTLVSRNRSIRRGIANDLRTEHAAAPSQIQLRVQNVNETKVGPYLHAASWETGRRLSGENAAWLTRFAATTRLDLAETRRHLEQLLGGDLQCPLGGKYELAGAGAGALAPAPAGAGTPHLVSTAWGKPSRFEETSVPADYRLPFLAWLRGMKLEFQLSPTTLTSHVELHVDPTVVKEVVRVDQAIAKKHPTIEAVVAAEGRQAYERLLGVHRTLKRALDRYDVSGGWATYLAIPAAAPASADEWQKLRAISARFKLVDTDPKYRVITVMSGFTDARSQLDDCLRILKDKSEK